MPRRADRNPKHPASTAYYYQLRLPIPEQPLLADRPDTLPEDRCRAWLAQHPTPPEDEFDRLCWQAISNYVTMMDNIRRTSHVEVPTDENDAGPTSD